jgi:hypothetical protein
MRADGLPVSYRTYRRVLDECMPAWPSLRAALDPDRVLLTPQELVFRAAWIEPQVMRARHPVEAREDELLAWECYRKARAGEDWAELVRAYTQVGRDRYKRGDTGLVRLADLPLPWSVVMFKAPLGDVQPPVLTAFGWHVGVVREIVPARTLDDGTVEPERRRIEQVELPYTPPAGTGMSAERALRILVGELRTRPAAVRRGTALLPGRRAGPAAAAGRRARPPARGVVRAIPRRSAMLPCHGRLAGLHQDRAAVRGFRPLSTRFRPFTGPVAGASAGGVDRC